jgi:DNA-binding MarR family transcriptional regulator
MGTSNMTSELVDLIHSLCSLCEKRNRIIYTELQLSDKEFEFFMQVNKFKNQSSKEISGMIDVPQATISRNINKLVNKGLLQRSHSQTDSRLVTIEYTDRGKSKYAYAYDNKCVGNNTIKKILKEKRYEELKAILQEIIQNFEV